MEFNELKNESENEFTDITSEEYRRYDFDGQHVIEIWNPVALSVSSSGGHRVLDGAGISHYIPNCWRHLEWKARDGQPHFVK